MHEAVSGQLVLMALHIDRQAGLPNLQRWFLIMTVGNPVSRTAMEMWVMHGDLRKISVSGAAKRMGQNEVEEVGISPSAAKTVVG